VSPGNLGFAAYPTPPWATGDCRCRGRQGQPFGLRPPPITDFPDIIAVLTNVIQLLAQFSEKPRSKVQSVDQRMRLGKRYRPSPTADVPSHTSGPPLLGTLVPVEEPYTASTTDYQVWNRLSLENAVWVTSWLRA
jgi:hypothetical protein